MSHTDKPMRLDAASDVNGAKAAFFLCLEEACGLRFPVTPGDRFVGRCPRCGSAVIEAAAVLPGGVPRWGMPGKRPVLHLLLDNWRSLFNVGSIFRTADGAGVTRVHLCGITPTPEHRKLAKTALGAEATVPWSYAPNAVAAAEALQTEKMALWVLEGGAASKPLWAFRLPAARPVVLAAGNEVVGVDPGLVERADQVVYLPMMGAKESLNVAVALSIAVYWLMGQALGAVDE